MGGDEFVDDRTSSAPSGCWTGRRARGLRLCTCRPTRSTATSRPPHRSQRGRSTCTARALRRGEGRRELMVFAYVRTYGINASIARGANAYGPNQFPEKFIPLLAINALDGRAAAGLRRRPAGARVHARRATSRRHRGRAHRGGAGRGLQLGGSNEAREHRDVAPRSSTDLARRGADPARRRPPRPRPALRDRLRKLRALGWDAARRFDEGLAETVRVVPRDRPWWEPIKSGEAYAAYHAAN